MKNPFEQYFKRGEKVVSLSVKDKDLIREGLISNMKKTSFNKTRNDLVWYSFLYRHAVTVSLCLILLLVGGTSVFAEKSLPGDLLYPFKTGVTEQVRGWFARSSQDKAEWQIALAERRFNEIQYLEESSSVSPEIKKNVLERFQEQINKVEEKNKEEDALEGNREEDKTKEASVGASSKASIMSAELKQSVSVEDRINLAKGRLAEFEKYISKGRPFKREKMLRLKTSLLIVKKSLLIDVISSIKAENSEKALESLKKAEENLSRFEKLLNEDKSSEASVKKENKEEAETSTETNNSQENQIEINSSEDQNSELRTSSSTEVEHENESSDLDTPFAL